MTLVVRQQGAGNGKSYDLVRSIVYGPDGPAGQNGPNGPNGPNGQHGASCQTVIVLTKPHTNKDMLYAEMMRALTGMNGINEGIPESSASSAKSESRSRAWIVEGTIGADGANGAGASGASAQKGNKRRCRAVFATIDAFMFAIGDPKKGGRAFESAVRSVDAEQLALSVPRDEDAAWLTFKGERIRVDKGCVLVDEAQDLDVAYVRALAAYARHTDARVVLIGDKLQSIQFEENAFTATAAAPFFEHEPPKNACRRFGANIADVVNRLVFDDPANKGLVSGLPPIVALSSVPGSVHIVKVTNETNETTKNETATDRTVREVMLALEREAARGVAPNEVLVVSPFVRNDKVMEALEMHIAAFWAERGTRGLQGLRGLQGPAGQSDGGHNGTDGQGLRGLQGLQGPAVGNDNGAEEALAYLHVSEPGHPVCLESSRNATRMVSIHASKGDGRRVVFVVGLTERALSRFCETESPHESLVYLSLLHVALTRAMETMYVLLHDRPDDITRRFSRAGLIGDDWCQPEQCAAWPKRPTLLRDMINSVVDDTSHVSTQIQALLDSLIPAPLPHNGPAAPRVLRTLYITI